MRAFPFGILPTALYLRPKILTMPPAIHIEYLSKRYKIGAAQKSSYRTLRESLTESATLALRRVRSHLKGLHNDSKNDEEFWALRDVSFDVQPGEVVGIIGRNGAGKSTLLKILSRITEPTSGRAVLRGRVASLLEVGTGFHPELTGRENIYLNGGILGMTRREVTRKFDAIVDFAGIEQFLDTPVKRYSSGMYVRLAFAVAAHLDPEILIIDEVLAVGDAEFQRKCLGKMHDIAKGGRTVLFVSHNMAAVEALCSHGLLLSDGEVTKAGQTHQVVEVYRNHILNTDDDSPALKTFDDTFFKSATLVNERGEPTKFITLGRQLRLRMQVSSSRVVASPFIGIGIDDIDGNRMLTVHTPRSGDAMMRIDGLCQIECVIPEFPLAPGQYKVKLATEANGQTLGCVDDALRFTVIDGELSNQGHGHHRGVCVARSRWSVAASDY